MRLRPNGSDKIIKKKCAQTVPSEVNDRTVLLIIRSSPRFAGCILSAKKKKICRPFERGCYSRSRDLEIGGISRGTHSCANTYSAHFFRARLHLATLRTSRKCFIARESYQMERRSMRHRKKHQIATEKETTVTVRH